MELHQFVFSGDKGGTGSDREVKNALVKSIRNFIEIIRAFRVLSPLDPKAFSFEDLD
jgi:hypothetical protein